MIREMMTYQLKTQWLASLTLLGWLMALGMSAQAQTAHGQGGGPPTVTIDQVRQVRSLPPTFLVGWSIQKPPATTIEGFTVKLEIKFSGGVRLNDSQAAGPTATSTTVQFPAQPANVTAQTFNAIIETRFKTPENSSITTEREFDLVNTGVQGGVASGGNLPPDHPVVQISSATTLSLDRFRLKWNVQSDPAIRIERFGVSGLVTYGFKQDGVTPIPPVTRQTPVTIAFSAHREAVVTVPDPPQTGTPSPVRIKVKLDTLFTRPVAGTVRVVKEGNF